MWRPSLSVHKDSSRHRMYFYVPSAADDKAPDYPSHCLILCGFTNNTRCIHFPDPDDSLTRCPE